MHLQLAQIDVFQPMSTYLKKSLAALDSLNLHVAKIPT